ncbi:MAG: SIMPL domain-containing protein [Burkholderiaceae bacterium]|nr:SIMPL domain-containing protein [Burkholderiaceae bacterium]
MHRSIVTVALLTAGLAAAQGAESAPPRDMLSIAASAVVEVPFDTLAITLQAVREGAEPGAVQTQLRQAIDAALADARRAVRPGQLEVRTGQFQLSPRYSNKGVISAWVGQAELVIDGRDMSAIAQLAGRLNSVAVSRVAYSLARDTREKAESDAAAQAITRFRARAGDYARQFGYANFVIREVNVSSESPHLPQPIVRAKAMSAAMASDESVPIEAGRANVVATVNGSVLMTR